MTSDRDPASPLWDRFLLYADAVQRVANERGGLVSSDETGFVLVAAALLVVANELHGGSA